MFYDTEGDVTDIANFKVVAKEVFLKDIGTVAFTSFNFGSDEVKRMMANEELMDYTIGKIHSHHSMNTFHSGTDWEDLWQNTETTNFYLSFITNNRFDLEVKIGWRVKQKVKTTTDYYMIGANGEQTPMQMEEVKEDFMFIVANGDITVESDNTPEQWFIDRLAEVKKSVAKQKEEASKAAAVSKPKGFPSVTPATKQDYKWSKAEIKKVKEPSEATNNFLAKFISMGSQSSVQNAVDAIEKLKKADFDIWEDNIFSGELWDGMYQRYFGNDFSAEKAVAEDCLKIMEKFKKENPDVAKVVIEFLDDKTLDEDEFDDTKDIPTYIFNEQYDEHIQFLNS